MKRVPNTVTRSRLAPLVLSGLVLVAAAAPGPARADESRVISLTAISSDGVWTTQDVNGVNYWRHPSTVSHEHAAQRHFSPATIVTKLGEVITLRLQSYDNEHGFHIPELGIGPYEVEEGEVEEIEVDTGQYSPGVYMYHCTIPTCSDLHYWMRGYFVIYPANGEFDGPVEVIDWNAKSIVPSKAQLASIPSEPSLARGKQLFLLKGCTSCHNQGAKGGIHNLNYEYDTIPNLDNRAEVLMLFDVAEGQSVIDILATGQDLTRDNLAALDIARAPVTLAQYHSMKELITGGKPDEGKRDVDGPEPPLSMPEWRHELSNADMNLVLAYLLSISEYDDGEIDTPEILPAVMTIPKSHHAALALFGEQEDVMEKYEAGNRIVTIIAIADLVIVIPFFIFYFRARINKNKDKKNG